MNESNKLISSPKRLDIRGEITFDNSKLKWLNENDIFIFEDLLGDFVKEFLVSFCEKSSQF